jgi:hypothetical protein
VRPAVAASDAQRDAQRDVQHDAQESTLLRRLLLALALFGMLGLTLDLFLLEHTGSPTQWIPFGVLAAGIASAAAVAVRPARATLRVFQGVMALAVAGGLLGLWLHYRGNVEFELESDPSLGGLTLFWLAVRGATPALAPAALAQVGLLGLLYTFRHPALRGTRAPAGPGRDEHSP